MPNVNPVVAAGFRGLFVGIKDSSAYLAGGLTASSAGTIVPMKRMRGALGLPVKAPPPDRKAVGGDDGYYASFTFQSANTPEGDLTLSIMDMDVDAVLQGTLVETIGDIKHGIKIPKDLNLQDVVLLVIQEGKFIPDATEAWVTTVYHSCNIFPQGQDKADKEISPYTHGVTLNKVQRTAWGKLLNATDNGTTQGGISELAAENPVMLVRAVGDNATTAFVLPFTPIEASGDKVIVYVDGVKKTYTADYTVTVGTDTVTFAVAPATDAKIVIMYEFDEAEL